VCGERIGVHEPIWHVAPSVGAVSTSWLQLEDRQRFGSSKLRLEALCHAECAEAEGIAGG